MATENTTLPASILRDHFPGSFSETGISLKTDGECLILQRVPIGGKLYDLRIYRWDDQDKLINVDENYKILSHVASEVQRTLQLYFEHHFRDNPDCNRYFYKAQPERFFIRDRKGQDSNVTGYHRDPALVDGRDVMAKLHNMFFSESRVSHSSEGPDLISPIRTAKHSFPTPVDSHGAQSSLPEFLTPDLMATQGGGIRGQGSSDVASQRTDGSHVKKLEEVDQSGVERTATGSQTTHQGRVDPLSPSDHGKLLPTGIRPEAAEGFPEAILHEPPVDLAGKRMDIEQDPYQAITEGLHDMHPPRTGCKYKNITYQSLSEYSILDPQERASVPQHEELDPALTAFTKLVDNPEDSSEDCQDMNLWLKDLWQQAYRNYKKLSAVYEREGVPTKAKYDFENWCKHYAAKSVVGFIKSGKPLDPLVEKLKKLPTE